MILGLFEIISSSLWFLEPSEIPQVTQKNNPPISPKLWAALWDRRDMKSRGGGLCLKCLLLLSFNLLSKSCQILSPRKIISSEVQRGRNFFFNRRKFTEISSNSKISSFLFFPRIYWINLWILLEFGDLQKISRNLLRIFVKNLTLKKF